MADYEIVYLPGVSLASEYLEQNENSNHDILEWCYQNITLQNDDLLKCKTIKPTYFKKKKYPYDVENIQNYDTILCSNTWDSIEDSSYAIFNQHKNILVASVCDGHGSARLCQSKNFGAAEMAQYVAHKVTLKLYKAIIDNVYKDNVEIMQNDKVMVENSSMSEELFLFIYNTIHKLDNKIINYMKETNDYHSLSNKININNKSMIFENDYWFNHLPRMMEKDNNYAVIKTLLPASTLTKRMSNLNITNKNINRVKHVEDTINNVVYINNNRKISGQPEYGCTLGNVIIYKDTLSLSYNVICTNVGDTQVVIVRYNNLECVYDHMEHISESHTVKNVKEIERMQHYIFNNNLNFSNDGRKLIGSKIINSDHYDKTTMNFGTEITRAFGHASFWKDNGMIVDPYISITTLYPRDIILMGTDGFWEDKHEGINSINTKKDILNNNIINSLNLILKSNQNLLKKQNMNNFNINKDNNAFITQNQLLQWQQHIIRWNRCWSYHNNNSNIHCKLDDSTLSVISLNPSL